MQRKNRKMDKYAELRFHRRRCRGALQNAIKGDCLSRRKAMEAQSADYILGEGPDPIKEEREKRKRQRGFSVGMHR